MSAPEPPAPPAPTEQRVALLGEIALEVAHELRNLLLIIDGSAYVAKQDVTKSGPQLDKIQRTVRTARDVVDDIFLIASGDAVPRERVALETVVARGRLELGDVIGDAGVEFVDAVGDARVTAHERLLARVFKVLYENAIQLRLPARARIETRVLGDGSIEIEDDGAGVAAELGERIFEPLVTSRPGGTGMGLPLARRIARAHGGELTLSKAQSGQGACFRLVLPA